MSLDISTITDAAAFATLGRKWDALVRAMPRPSPFLLHAWQEEWFRHVGTGCDLLVVTAHPRRRARRRAATRQQAQARRARRRVHRR